MEEKPLVVKPGQKFRHIGSNAVYIVKRIRDDFITVMSEDRKASMLIQIDDLMSADFEPV